MFRKFQINLLTKNQTILSPLRSFFKALKKFYDAFYTIAEIDVIKFQQYTIEGNIPSLGKMSYLCNHPLYPISNAKFPSPNLNLTPMLKV